ncbi:hypothetical protein [Parabacteroides faecis]|uniref:hypothetical protein n=1 Tax=Parabacteroides faecis TaxID=1217282 RepID=UPI002165F6E0|nr:hypothetical protein [Parabacteroides faecis]MCS2892589.1 hypothetical protein [Parabacteroides faecis]
MKQFLYTLSTILFLFQCTACTEAEVMHPDGGKQKEESAPLSVKSLGMWVEVESRSVVTGGPGGGRQESEPAHLRCGMRHQTK